MRALLLIAVLIGACSEIRVNSEATPSSSGGNTANGGFPAGGGRRSPASNGGSAATSGQAPSGGTGGNLPPASSGGAAPATGGLAASTGGLPTAAGGSKSSGGATSAGTGGSASSGGSPAGACDAGTTETAWATACPTAPPAECKSGSWSPWGSSSPENYPLRYETEHFAFYWPDERNVAVARAEAAGKYLEEVVWKTYMGSPIFFPEPYCTATDKKKVSVHLIESGLYGGCNEERPGIWVGPGALEDHWGLAHELMHSLQCMTPGVPDCGDGGCWFHESHANFMPHQLQEYRGDVHCSEMLVNAPHLYYGSTRDRYCNWQFFEFVKDKYCYSAINQIWTGTAPNGLRDPLNKLAATQGWDTETLNDVFGEWAMHNVTWDYQNPPPTSGNDQGPTYRAGYGAITDTSKPERRLRLTELEPLDDGWAETHRFASPYFIAPQRFGYNVVRLVPEPGAESVSVTFRGVTKDSPNAGFRWGLLATDAELTRSRYSALQRGTDGALEFCLSPGESLWLVVVATPTVVEKVVWDQPYPSIRRYPYLVEVHGAWPLGFEGGARAACPAGTEPHSNGGGCARTGTPASVHVGPYARVLGGTVSGSARIEDHAVILNGATVSGGTVGAFSILSRFTVSGSATIQTTFYPPGFFEPGQAASGTARLYGDVEYRGEGLNRSSGAFYGFVDAMTQSATIDDVTPEPPYEFRP
jgi:hypothetical protein